MPDPLYQYKPFGKKEIPDGGIPDIEGKVKISTGKYPIYVYCNNCKEKDTSWSGYCEHCGSADVKKVKS